MGKTEENVRIPFRLHNISRFPRAASPLLYLLLFLHSHRKGRPDGRPFLVREAMGAATWDPLSTFPPLAHSSPSLRFVVE